jgi:hypothetical protein
LRLDVISEDWMRAWELASYVVTVVGLPLAVWVLTREARKERASEEKELEQRREEIYQELSDEYVQFLKLLLQYPELRLLDPQPSDRFTPEQREQRFLIFGILVSLLERAYILLYEPDLDEEGRRRWQSWDDYARVWCARADFREALARHIEGEDPAFREYILGIAGQAEAGAAPR